jgi:hypothetical protein
VILLSIIRKRVRRGSTGTLQAVAVVHPNEKVPVIKHRQEEEAFLEENQEEFEAQEGEETQRF